MNKKLTVLFSIILTLLVSGYLLNLSQPSQPKRLTVSKLLPKPLKVKFDVSSCAILAQAVTEQANAKVTLIGKRTKSNKAKSIETTKKLSTVFLNEQKNFKKDIRPYMRKVSEAAVEELAQISTPSVITWSYSIDNAYLKFVDKIRELGYVGGKCL